MMMMVLVVMVSCRSVWLGAGVQSVPRAARGLAVLDDARATQDVGGIVAVQHLAADVGAQCGLRPERRQSCNDHRRIRSTQCPRLHTGHCSRQLGSTASRHVGGRIRHARVTRLNVL